MKIVSEEMLYDRLDAELLQKIKIVPDAPALDKTIIRAKTSLFYKQKKFNLQREESQGYARLCVALVENLVHPLQNYWFKGADHKELVETRLKDIDYWAGVVNNNLSSLIGSFDLDPNRVLDIVLDAFIANFVDYWEFFISLLLKSPWRPLNGSPKQIVAQILGLKLKDADLSSDHSLYWVMALLIRHEILALDDIYPHLHPSDGEIENDYNQYLSKLSRTASKAGRFAPIAFTNDLNEDVKKIALPTSIKMAERISMPSGSSDNQKARLARQLAAIGDLKNTRILLDRNPQLAKMFHALTDNLCRIVHVVLEPVDSLLRPLSKIFRPVKKPLESFKPAISTSTVHSCQIVESVSLGRDKEFAPSYRFFYQNWKDDIPLPSSYAGVLKVIRPFLVYIGSFLYRDILLLGKLIRIGRAHLSENADDEPIKNAWLSIISQIIFPAISQLTDNSNIIKELWLLLNCFPYKARYALYGEWSRDTYDKFPELEVAASGCKKDVNFVMSRLSKENYLVYGRYIGKIVHSNPTFALPLILSRIEESDNMIPFFLDTTKYFSEFAFDVLCYSFLDYLAKDHRSRIEGNGSTIEKWLKSLSTFCGLLFKGQSIGLDSVLQYLVNQLLSDQVYDLIILQEIISVISGVEASPDATEVQIEGFSGGPLLRRESALGDYKVHRSYEEPTRLFLTTLMASQLAMPLGILISQQHRKIVYSFRKHEEDPSLVPNIKVLAWLSDHCRRAFLQYFAFLTDNLSSAPEILSKKFPSLVELIQTHGIAISSAFHILRPYYNAEIMKLLERSESLVLPQIIHDIGSLGLAAPLTPKFYALFWELQLSDLVCPSQYENELRKIIIEEKKLSRHDKSGLAYTKGLIAGLREERETQKNNQELIMQALKREKDTFFDEKNVSLSFLQQCIFPRCILSPADAIYCSTLIITLHRLGGLHFSSLDIFHSLLSPTSMQAMIFSITEGEAKNYGLFVSDLMKSLMSWHSTEKLFEEAINPGCAILMSSEVYMSHNEYRETMYKWHCDLRICFLGCLESGEYMQRRNGMMILDKLSDSFPMIIYMGVEFEKAVKKIEKEEERRDVMQMARSYFGKLKLKHKTWISANKFWNQPAGFIHEGFVPADPHCNEAEEIEPGEMDVDDAEVLPSSDANVDEKKETSQISAERERSPRGERSREPIQERENDRGREDRGRSRTREPDIGTPKNEDISRAHNIDARNAVREPERETRNDRDTRPGRDSTRPADNSYRPRLAPDHGRDRAVDEAVKDRTDIGKDRGRRASPQRDNRVDRPTTPRSTRNTPGSSPRPIDRIVEQVLETEQQRLERARTKEEMNQKLKEKMEKLTKETLSAQSTPIKVAVIDSAKPDITDNAPEAAQLFDRISGVSKDSNIEETDISIAEIAEEMSSADKPRFARPPTSKPNSRDASPRPDIAIAVDKIPEIVPVSSGAPRNIDRNDNDGRSQRDAGREIDYQRALDRNGPPPRDNQRKVNERDFRGNGRDERIPKERRNSGGFERRPAEPAFIGGRESDRRFIEKREFAPDRSGRQAEGREDPDRRMPDRRDNARRDDRVRDDRGRVEDRRDDRRVDQKRPQDGYNNQDPKRFKGNPR